jgi:hypothetical protein
LLVYRYPSRESFCVSRARGSTKTSIEFLNLAQNAFLMIK